MIETEEFKVSFPTSTEASVIDQPPEVAGLIDSMRATLALLESELRGVEAYRAILQLDAREAAGDLVSVMGGGELRRMLHGELQDLPAFRAKLRLDQALLLLEKGELPLPARHAAPVVAVAAVVPDQVATAEPALPRPESSVVPLQEMSAVSGPAMWVAQAVALARAGAMAPVDSPLDNAVTESAAIADAAPKLIEAAQSVLPVDPVPDPIPAPDVPVASLLTRFPPEQYVSEAEAVIYASLARLREPAPPKSAVEVTGGPDRLDLITGVDAELSQAMVGEGVDRFAQIANWTSVDIARISSRLGLGDRVSQLGWIEQAAMLARGVETLRARRKSQGWKQVPLPGEHQNVSALPVGNPAFFAIGLRAMPEASEPAPAVASAPKVLIVTEPDAHWAPAANSGDTVEYVAEEIMIRPRRRDLPMAGAMANVAAAVAATVAAAKNIRGGAPKDIVTSSDGQAEVIIRPQSPPAPAGNAATLTAADAAFLPAYRRDAHVARAAEPASRALGTGDEAIVEIRRPAETPPVMSEHESASAQPSNGQATMLKRLVRSFSRDDRPW